MMWYYYLNYRIYRFYEHKNEDIPASYSFLVTTLLMTINLSSILYLAIIFQGELRIYLYKYISVIILGIVGICNFLILYRNSHYKELFNEFELFEEHYKHWNLSVKVYIILSVVFFVGVLFVADLQNQGII
jgi:hypothetical protein